MWEGHNKNSQLVVKTVAAGDHSSIGSDVVGCLNLYYNLSLVRETAVSEIMIPVMLKSSKYEHRE